jgi:exosortase
MSVLATKRSWRAIALVSVVLFTYATVLVKLSHDWWSDENYSHGLLVPFIIGYILWLQRGRFAAERARPSVLLGAAAVAVAIFALWSGVAGAELYTQRMSLVLLAAGIVVYFCGLRFLRLVLVPLVLLTLAIPIPTIVFNKIAFPLQLFASRVAVWSMTLLGIPVLRQGNVIELKPLNSFNTKKLEVVEACSGIRSMMTLITLAVVFAYFTYPRSDDSSGPRDRMRRYGFVRTSIIVLSAVPIAIVTNAARVSGTGILSHYYGTGVADGFFHTFSGWAIYVVAFLMLFGIGWILDRFKPRGPKTMDKRRKIKDERGAPENAVATAASVVPAEGVE